MCYMRASQRCQMFFDLSEPHQYNLMAAIRGPDSGGQLDWVVKSAFTAPLRMLAGASPNSAGVVGWGYWLDFQGRHQYPILADAWQQVPLHYKVHLLDGWLAAEHLFGQPDHSNLSPVISAMCHVVRDGVQLGYLDKTSCFNVAGLVKRLVFHYD